jgi:hypothetical protein
VYFGYVVDALLDSYSSGVGVTSYLVEKSTGYLMATSTNLYTNDGGTVVFTKAIDAENDMISMSYKYITANAISEDVTQVISYNTEYDMVIRLMKYVGEYGQWIDMDIVVVGLQAVSSNNDDDDAVIESESSCDSSDSHIQLLVATAGITALIVVVLIGLLLLMLLRLQYIAVGNNSKSTDTSVTYETQNVLSKL